MKDDWSWHPAEQIARQMKALAVLAGAALVCFLAGVVCGAALLKWVVGCVA